MKKSLTERNKLREATSGRKKRTGKRKEEALQTKLEQQAPCRGRNSWGVRKGRNILRLLPPYPTPTPTFGWNRYKKNRYKKKLGARAQRTQMRWRHDQTVVWGDESQEGVGWGQGR